jgi:preprotein translocase subunit SecG
LIIIIAIVAVVVALAVVAVIVLKKKGAQSSPDRGVAFGGVGFENPLCKFCCCCLWSFLHRHPQT